MDSPLRDTDILLTGGTGRLGEQLRQLLPGIIAPPRSELDLTDPVRVYAALERYQPKLVVHAAAYTDVAGAEQNREACWRVNVDGTRSLVRGVLEHGAALLHISTDYVFYGDHGHYREDDPIGPVRNYYALSKLVAEAVARTVPRHLVVRTSFRPTEWPYPKAFTDVYTSQDYVDIIAPQIATAIRRFADIPFDTLHIATERKSVFELARRRKPEVEAGSKHDVAVDLPSDISLDISRWQQLALHWQS